MRQILQLSQNDFGRSAHLHVSLALFQFTRHTSLFQTHSNSSHHGVPGTALVATGRCCCFAFSSSLMAGFSSARDGLEPSEDLPP